MQISENGLTLSQDTMTLQHHIGQSAKLKSDYLYVPLDIPEATSALEGFTVSLDYAKSDEAVIDLGLFDPRVTAYPSKQGFRGWSGGARSHFSLSQNFATPGYIPGPIMTGRWLIALGLYRVPAAGIDIQLKIQRGLQDPLWKPTTKQHMRELRGPAWFRGDCHSHTFHSDAKGSPHLLEATARALGLDFLFVTDHNNTTAWDAHFSSAGDADILFVPGMEITTAAGHANILGTEQWIDFRHEKDADIPALVTAAQAAGGLFSINHDKPPIPWNRAWPDNADCMEIWHEDRHDGTSPLLTRFDALLRAGKRITGIGGSDWHQSSDMRLMGERALAAPTTVAWAEKLDREHLLASIRAGHVYVTESPSGPHLELQSGDIKMGGTVPRGHAKEVRITTHGAKGNLLRLVGENGPIDNLEIEADNWFHTYLCTDNQAYIRAEILAISDATNGSIQTAPIRALSNPIYFSK